MPQLNLKEVDRYVEENIAVFHGKRLESLSTLKFEVLYTQVINAFVKAFVLDFCDEHGAINWEKLVKFNSGNADR